MKSCWRLINSVCRDAPTNMAIDEAIFRGVLEGSVPPTLRLYGWEPHAFSIGYGQHPQSVLDVAACRQDGVGIVRRITGGGAILHGDEVTYSLAATKADFGLNDSISNSFKVICAFILHAYRQMGLKPSFAVETDSVKEKVPLGAAEAFCFAGKEKYDILIAGKKLGGNAQRREKAAIFQHGSIPLRFDAAGPLKYLLRKPSGLDERVCALGDALGRSVCVNEIKDILIASFSATFGVTLQGSALTPKEQQRAETLYDEKYARDEWTLYGNKHWRTEKAGMA
jgi:lipoate-protein ligase A